MIQLEKVLHLKQTANGNHILLPECEVLIKNKKDVYCKPIPEKDARSLQQMRYYWKIVLPTFCSHIDGMESYVIQTEKGFDYEPAHRYLTLRWALDRQRVDLIKKIPAMQNNKIVECAIVSFSFNNCSQKDANDYIEYINNICIKKTSKKIDELSRQEI